jgi:hypothetical protein
MAQHPNSDLGVRIFMMKLHWFISGENLVNRNIYLYIFISFKKRIAVGVNEPALLPNIFAETLISI